MRRAGPCAWMGALLGTLACSGAPSPSSITGEADVADVESPVGPSTRADDPLLARARGQMRRGRVPDAVREQLLASRDPDHRRAARLLQAVAGETPAAVLPRDVVEPEPPTREPEPTVREPELAKPPEPAPAPPTEPTPTPTVQDTFDDEHLDPLPKLADVPLGSPLRAWLEGSVLELEPEPPPAPLELPREVGPELLLLRERPPRPPSSEGLVILTRATLRAEPDVTWLDLAGSGPVGVSIQPLDEHRVRLTIADAGAVPSFLAARPEGAGVTILDVARRDRDVELELALAPGWRIAFVERLDNGAAVGCSRFDTLPP